jgi:aerobic-type carbon monoxide dehydrogenase small subunit (CoxS/CutS family)
MKLIVNGREREVTVGAGETLLGVLRDRLHLTGAKPGCERGECGACTVLLDDDNVYSCLTLAVACEGRRVTTIEGLAGASELHPLQQRFIENDAVQCGFCTPGQILAAVALLRRDPAPTPESIAHGMSGNLCRCGTYPKIARAILASTESPRA